MSQTSGVLGDWRPSPTGPVALGPREVHVWRAPLRRTAAELGTLADTLSKPERERGQRFRSRVHRDGFVAARGLLRSLLGRYLGRAPDAISFAYGKAGKPRVASGGVRFNLSHSGGLALFAFARRFELGVDLEWLGGRVELEEVARSVFSERELETLFSLEGTSRQQAFFRCWTRKEAFIKALGDGFSFPLQSFDVSLDPGEPARLIATRSDPALASRWRIHDLAPGADHAGALAVEVGHGGIRLFDV